MILAFALTLATAQFSPTAPPVGLRLIDASDSLLVRIMALDHQLRAPAPTWAAPLSGAGLGVAALTFGLTALGVSTGATGIVVLFMVLGTMLGIVGLIGGVVAGVYGFAEAARRAELEERRERLLDELDRRRATFAAVPRSA
ncbi:MAG: hypothetical protein Q8L14_21155 [Myxococcales bacterium]|nr:hypothetical protein [Myxococcales bacterium]